MKRCTHAYTEYSKYGLLALCANCGKALGVICKHTGKALHVDMTPEQRGVHLNYEHLRTRSYFD